MKITVTKALGEKCPRCWKMTLAGLFNFDHLCDACCQVMLLDYQDHPAVPHIRASYAAQRQHWGVN